MFWVWNSSVRFGFVLIQKDKIQYFLKSTLSFYPVLGLQYVSFKVSNYILLGFRVAWNRLKTWADFANIEDRVGYFNINVNAKLIRILNMI